MDYFTQQHPAYYAVETKEVISPFVVASPHSGNEYVDTFKGQSTLDSHTLRSSEDAFVNELIDFVPSLGAPILCAKAPRAFVDLNRAETEIDPAVIKNATYKVQNPRIASGLGIIPRVVANGRPIYTGKLSLSQAKARIDHYWRPYHEKLDQMLLNAHRKFGYAVLIDVHSMPHEAISASMPYIREPSIVLGDRFGVTCSSRISNEIEVALTNAGFFCARNNPFAGAYIVQRYGRPSQNYHAIQVEIDRALYMDEIEITKNNNFDNLKKNLKNAFRCILSIKDNDKSLAAE